MQWERETRFTPLFVLSPRIRPKIAAVEGRLAVLICTFTAALWPIFSTVIALRVSRSPSLWFFGTVFG